MSWFNLESFEEIRQRLGQYVEDDRLTIYPFHNVESYYSKRFFKIQFGSIQLLLKMEELTGKDSLKKEYLIGLQLNRLRNLVPNFPGTFAYFKGSPQTKRIPPAGATKTSADIRFLVLEFLDGRSISPRASFDHHCRHLLQVFTALDLANQELGFTHYNLHRGNVLCRPCEEPVIINYPDFRLETPFISVIIDFGRSFTNQEGGTKLESHSVYRKPNILHDIFLFLLSTLRKKYPKECQTLCRFYGLEYYPGNSNYVNLQQVVEGKGKYRTPKQLLKFMEREFGFRALKNKHKEIVYRPISYPSFTVQPVLNELVDPSEEEVRRMQRFRNQLVD